MTEHYERMAILRQLLAEKQSYRLQLQETHDDLTWIDAQIDALQYAIDNLSLDGPLTFSARYYKRNYEAAQHAIKEYVCDPTAPMTKLKAFLQ